MTEASKLRRLERKLRDARSGGKKAPRSGGIPMDEVYLSAWRARLGATFAEQGPVMLRAALASGTRKRRPKYNFPAAGESATVKTVPGIVARRLAAAKKSSSNTKSEFVGPTWNSKCGVWRATASGLCATRHADHFGTGTRRSKSRSLAASVGAKIEGDEVAVAHGYDAVARLLGMPVNFLVSYRCPAGVLGISRTTLIVQTGV